MDETNYQLYGKYKLPPHDKREQSMRAATCIYRKASSRIAALILASNPRTYSLMLQTEKRSEQELMYSNNNALFEATKIVARKYKRYVY